MKNIELLKLEFLNMNENLAIAEIYFHGLKIKGIKVENAEIELPKAVVSVQNKKLEKELKNAILPKYFEELARRN